MGPNKLKRVGTQYEVLLVFSPPSKLGSLCTGTDPNVGDQGRCVIKYETCFTTCKTKVIYQIPFSCGKVYISQTGRCVNQRLREHAHSVCTSLSGNLAVHCNRCGCNRSPSDTRILGQGRESVGRKTTEAFFITLKGSGSVCHLALIVLIAP